LSCYFTNRHKNKTKSEKKSNFPKKTNNEFQTKQNKKKKVNMKFSTTAVMALLLAEQTNAFAPSSPVKTNYRSQSSSTKSSPKSSSSLSMAIDIDVGDVAGAAAPPSSVAIEQKAPEMIVKNPGGGPSDVRYSEFLRLVDGDKIEKVTFSSDGTQLLGVDVDGTRLKIQSLPNDPDLLTQLTSHKVRYH
jgi:cell division protease FtsH